MSRKEAFLNTKRPGTGRSVGIPTLLQLPEQNALLAIKSQQQELMRNLPSVSTLHTHGRRTGKEYNEEGMRRDLNGLILPQDFFNVSKKRSKPKKSGMFNNNNQENNNNDISVTNEKDISVNFLKTDPREISFSRLSASYAISLKHTFAEFGGEDEADNDYPDEFLENEDEISSQAVKELMDLDNEEDEDAPPVLAVQGPSQPQTAEIPQLIATSPNNQPSSAVVGKPSIVVENAIQTSPINLSKIATITTSPSKNPTSPAKNPTSPAKTPTTPTKNPTTPAKTASEGENQENRMDVEPETNQNQAKADNIFKTPSKPANNMSTEMISGIFSPIFAKEQDSFMDIENEFKPIHDLKVSGESGNGNLSFGAPLLISPQTPMIPTTSNKPNQNDINSLINKMKDMGIDAEKPKTPAENEKNQAIPEIQAQTASNVAAKQKTPSPIPSSTISPAQKEKGKETAEKTKSAQELKEKQEEGDDYLMKSAKKSSKSKSKKKNQKEEDEPEEEQENKKDKEKHKKQSKDKEKKGKSKKDEEEETSHENDKKPKKHVSKSKKDDAIPDIDDELPQSSSLIEEKEPETKKKKSEKRDTEKEKEDVPAPRASLSGRSLRAVSRKNYSNDFLEEHYEERFVPPDPSVILSSPSTTPQKQTSKSKHKTGKILIDIDGENDEEEKEKPKKHEKKKKHEKSEEKEEKKKIKNEKSEEKKKKPEKSEEKEEKKTRASSSKSKGKEKSKEDQDSNAMDIEKEDGEQKKPQKTQKENEKSAKKIENEPENDQTSKTSPRRSRRHKTSINYSEYPASETTNEPEKPKSAPEIEEIEEDNSKTSESSSKPKEKDTETSSNKDREADDKKLSSKEKKVRTKLNNSIEIIKSPLKPPPPSNSSSSSQSNKKKSSRKTIRTTEFDRVDYEVNTVEEKKEKEKKSLRPRTTSQQDNQQTDKEIDKDKKKKEKEEADKKKKEEEAEKREKAEADKKKKEEEEKTIKEQEEKEKKKKEEEEKAIKAQEEQEKKKKQKEKEQKEKEIQLKKQQELEEQEEDKRRKKELQEKAEKLEEENAKKLEEEKSKKKLKETSSDSRVLTTSPLRSSETQKLSSEEAYAKEDEDDDGAFIPGAVDDDFDYNAPPEGQENEKMEVENEDPHNFAIPAIKTPDSKKDKFEENKNQNENATPPGQIQKRVSFSGASASSFTPPQEYLDSSQKPSRKRKDRAEEPENAENEDLDEEKEESEGSIKRTRAEMRTEYRKTRAPRPNYVEYNSSDPENQKGHKAKRRKLQKNKDDDNKDEEDDSEYQYNSQEEAEIEESGLSPNLSLAPITNADYSVIRKKKNILPDKLRDPDLIAPRMAFLKDGAKPDPLDPTIVYEPITPRPKSKIDDKRAASSSSSSISSSSSSAISSSTEDSISRIWKSNKAGKNKKIAEIESRRGKYLISHPKASGLIQHRVVVTPGMVKPVEFVEENQEEDEEEEEGEEDDKKKNLPVGAVLRMYFNTKSFKTGLITIRGNSRKPRQKTNGTTEVLNVVSGKAEVEMNGEKFYVEKYIQFVIPPHNEYEVKNPYNNDCVMSYLSWQTVQ